VHIPLPAESALFRPKVPFFVEECNFQCLSLLLETPKKALVHCTKPKIFSRKKNAFFATRKDVETYSQMPGKCILALEFSSFSQGSLSGTAPLPCVPFFRGCTPRSRNHGSAPVLAALGQSWRSVKRFERSAQDQRILGSRPSRTQSTYLQCSWTGLSKAEWCEDCLCFVHHGII
jgi:hypothetical protein